MLLLVGDLVDGWVIPSHILIPQPLSHQASLPPPQPTTHLGTLLIWLLGWRVGRKRTGRNRDVSNGMAARTREKESVAP